MSDIVERLRESYRQWLAADEVPPGRGCIACELQNEAAAEITRLREKVAHYERFSESGESLGGELEEREARLVAEAEITRLREKVRDQALTLLARDTETDEAWQRAERAEADAERLREFVAAIFEATDWPEGGDVEVSTFQDLCAAHGILLPETHTEPCGENCWCDEYHGGAEGMAGGVTCYRKPQWLLAAARKEGR